MSKLFSKTSFLEQAAALLAKPHFTREDSSRADVLISLAQLMPEGAGRDDSMVGSGCAAELKVLEPFLSHSRNAAWAAAWDKRSHMNTDEQQRDMSVEAGSPAGSLGGFLVPQAFRLELARALRQYDQIFDDDVTTPFETIRGAPCKIASIDDTHQAATVIQEGGPSVIDEDPTVEGVMLGIAPTYRSGLIKVSLEMLQDSAFSPISFLADSFAVRLARGIGKDLVAALLADAKLGRVVTGYLLAEQASPATYDGANTVGYQDLIQLVRSVNAAYRRSQKCYFLMNDDTLLFLDNLLDAVGRPILHPVYDSQGRRILLGFPVAICPSMADIGPSNIPIAFGATEFFVRRTVKQGTQISEFRERWAEFGVVAYESRMRVDGVLTCAAGADSPVKYLQNTASA